MGVGSERNKACFCGSGRKTKNCHGVGTQTRPLHDAVVRVPWQSHGTTAFIHNPQYVGEDGHGTFDCYIRCAVAGDYRECVPEPINDPKQYTVAGDSQFIFIPKPGLTLGIGVEDIGRYETVFHSNAEGRLGGVEIRGISAPTSGWALGAAMTVFNKFACVNSVVKQAPLNYAAALLMSRHDGRWTALVRTGFPISTIDFGNYPQPSVVATMFGHVILEAMRAESPHYEVLCYYKIGEYVKEKRGRLIAALRERGLEPTLEKRRIPSDPFAQVCPDYVDLKLFDALSKVNERARRFVAHLLPEKDGLVPNTFYGDEEAKKMSVVARYAINQLLQDFEIDTVRLMDSGVTVSQFAELMEIHREPSEQGLMDLGA